MREDLPIENKEKLVGKITHFFSNIKVAVVELKDELKVGDTIRIVGGETDFVQKVESMEVEHQKVDVGRPGDVVGLKVEQKVREGYRVYKIEEQK